MDLDITDDASLRDCEEWYETGGLLDRREVRDSAAAAPVFPFTLPAEEAALAVLCWLAAVKSSL